MTRQSHTSHEAGRAAVHLAAAAVVHVEFGGKIGARQDEVTCSTSNACRVHRFHDEGARLGSEMVTSRASLPPNMNVLEAFSVTDGRLDRSGKGGGKMRVKHDTTGTHIAHVTSHTSHLTRYTLHVMCHKSYVTCYELPVARAGRIERGARASRKGEAEEGEDRTGTPE